MARRAATPTWRVPIPWILFFLLLSVAGTGERPLWDPDEGRYAEVAREMYESGNWLIPTLEGNPHFTKPPLTYWLSATGFHLFGLNAWGARIFVTISFFLTILCVIELAATWGWNREQSLASGLVFSTAILPFAGGHLLTTDMILTFFETAGILCVWKVWTGKPGAGFWRLGFWLAFGLAFLTKGPPGWLPLAAVAAASLMGGRPRSGARLFSFSGVGLFLLISLSWFVVLSAGNSDRSHYFLVDELYNRVFTSEHGRNNPWWIHIVGLSAGLFPWVFLWPSILQRSWGSIRQGWSPLSPEKRFSVLWLLLPLAVFLLAKSRMTLYVMPLFVPISLWSGKLLQDGYLDERAPQPPSRRMIIPAVGLWIILIIGLSMYGGPLPGEKSEKRLAHQIIESLGDRVAATDFYMVDGLTQHSAAFYLRSDLTYVDFSSERLPWIREAQNAKGRSCVFMIKESRFKKVTRHDIPVRVIGEDNKLIAFEILPAESNKSAGSNSIPSQSVSAGENDSAWDSGEHVAVNQLPEA